MAICTPASGVIINWNSNPVSATWENSGNWTPAQVPNDSADTAVYGATSVSNIDLSTPIEVSGITLTSAAISSYTININPNGRLILSGAGFVNGSSYGLGFNVAADDGAGRVGQLSFTNSASAGTLSIFNRPGTSASRPGGITQF